MYDLPSRTTGTAARWDADAQRLFGDFMLSKALMGYGTVLGSIRSSIERSKARYNALVNEYGASRHSRCTIFNPQK